MSGKVLTHHQRKIIFGIGRNDQGYKVTKTLFPFIWYFLKEYKSIVFVVIFFNVIAGFWGPFNSILSKQLIDLLPSANDGDISILALPASLIIINFIVF